MDIKQTKSFNTISARILYGFSILYSEFIPVESEKADEVSQRKVHELMGQMIGKLYIDPKSLNLADAKDEAYEWYSLNNSKPDLDAIYKSIFRSLYNFYKYLYVSFLYGEMKDNHLSVANKTLSENKASYKSIYKSFLNEFGIDVEKRKAETVYYAETDILKGLRLLAKRTPVNVNNWTPYALLNFACCSFSNDFDFLVKRIDDVVGLNGLLLEIEDNYIENGYEKSLHPGFGPAGFEFKIKYRKKVGGFVIGYNPRKYWQFHFGSMNSIGVKAMLEDFENLDIDIQKYLLEVCKICSGCLVCTKGGRNKILAVKVRHEGNEYELCNDNFARHNWETINHNLAGQLFKYNTAQERYGSNWKKKR